MTEHLAFFFSEVRLRSFYPNMSKSNASAVYPIAMVPCSSSFFFLLISGKQTSAFFFIHLLIVDMKRQASLCSDGRNSPFIDSKGYPRIDDHLYNHGPLVAGDLVLMPILAVP
jgi:hypothetical protein